MAQAVAILELSGEQLFLGHLDDLPQPDSLHFDNQFDRFFRRAQNLCLNRKQLIKTRNGIKKQQIAERHSLAAQMVVDQYGHWNESIQTRHDHSAIQKFNQSLGSFSKHRSLQANKDNAKHRQAKNTHVLQTGQVQQLLIELRHQSQLEGLQMRTQQYQDKKQKLIKERVKQNKNVQLARLDTFKENRKAEKIRIREKQSKLRKDIADRWEQLHGNQDKKNKEDRQQRMEKFQRDMEKLREMEMARQVALEQERELGDKILMEAEEKEQQFKEHMQSMADTLRRRVEQRQREQEEKQEVIKELQHQQRQNALLKQLRRQEGTKDHLNKHRAETTKERERKKKITQYKKQRVAENQTQEHRKTQQWNKSIRQKQVHRDTTQENLLREKQMRLDARFSRKHAQTSQVLQTNHVNEVHRIEKHSIQHQESMRSLRMEKQCRMMQNRTVTEHLQEQVQCRKEEEKLKHALLQMMSKGTFDRHRLLTVVDQMHVDEEYKQSVLAMLGPETVPPDPND